MTRFLMSIGNLVFAFFLGALVLAFTFVQFPDLFSQILDSASGVKSVVVDSVPVSDEAKPYKNFMRFIVEEAQLVFMFFVIVARIILSLCIWAVSSLLNLAN